MVDYQGIPGVNIPAGYDPFIGLSMPGFGWAYNITSLTDSSVTYSANGQTYIHSGAANPAWGAGGWTGIKGLANSFPQGSSWQDVDGNTRTVGPNQIITVTAPDGSQLYSYGPDENPQDLTGGGAGLSAMQNSGLGQYAASGSSSAGGSYGAGTSSSSTGTNANNPTGNPAVSSSAKALITGTLSKYGLGSLANWAWKKWQNGESIDQIMLELRDTKEYKTRFPAMDALSKSGHAISEAQYIDLEQTYIQIGRQYGLPSGFYDQPSDFTKLIAGQVSPAEYQQRVQDYSTLAYETDPAVRAELRRLYGIDEGHIAAYAMNPDLALPVLQRQFGATQAAAAAGRSSWGQLDVNQAELLSGLSPEQLQQGFGTLYANKELFSPLPGEAGVAVDKAHQLSAAFLGDAATQQAIDRRQRERMAVFGGGGSTQQSQKGYAGVG